MTEEERHALSALHNELVGEIVPRIIGSIKSAGGDFPQAMTVLEGVICGVVNNYVVTGGDEVVLSGLFEAVARRLTEMRLHNAVWRLARDAP